MIKEFHLQVDSAGRMVIPKPIRKKLNIEKGTKLVVKIEGGEMHITTMKKAIQNARALVNKYCKGVDLLGELFNMRQEDLRQEGSFNGVNKKR